MSPLFRPAAAVAVFLALAGAGRAAPPPLVERYLHAGEFARGEHALVRALDANPGDDQARFGLGVLQFARAVERFGRSLYEFGVRSDNTSVPFLRVPVPANPDPTPVTYPLLRRAFEQFADDLAKAEATLAKVAADDVALPLRLADVRFDFAGDGARRQKLTDVIARLTPGQGFDFLRADPTFLVRFDRADVAWFRGYCHLLSAMIDLYLAFDTKALFDQFGGDHFARPKGRDDVKGGLFGALTPGLRVADPGRLRSLRLHLIAVCELNRETWRFARAERDDDHEWLPNARQTGVLGLPVRDDMVDGWLAAANELEAVLKGDKLVVTAGVPAVPDGSGINVRAFLDDPPAKLDLFKVLSDGVDPKYLGKLTGTNRADDLVFNRATSAFGAGLGAAYAGWFN